MTIRPGSHGRGNYGIGVWNMKREINYGTLFRTAYNFHAAFIFLIGRRFEKQASDTTRAEKSIPLFEFVNADDFLAHRPHGYQLFGIEICPTARDIRQFCHPERAIYLLGPEDGSLPSSILEHCNSVIQIPTRVCLNVAVAGGIVLYDRLLKQESREGK